MGAGMVASRPPLSASGREGRKDGSGRGTDGEPLRTTCELRRERAAAGRALLCTPNPCRRRTSESKQTQTQTQTQKQTQKTMIRLSCAHTPLAFSSSSPALPIRLLGPLRRAALYKPPALGLHTSTPSRLPHSHLSPSAASLPQMSPQFTIPKTQKAAIVESTAAPLKIVNDHPVPQPEDLAPGECLVELEVSGVCHTDLHARQGDWPIPAKLPLIGGHEVWPLRDPSRPSLLTPILAGRRAHRRHRRAHPGLARQARRPRGHQVACLLLPRLRALPQGPRAESVCLAPATADFMTDVIASFPPPQAA